MLSAYSKSDTSSKKQKSTARNTVSADLFDYEELSYSCDTCVPKVDVLSHSRKRKK